MEGEATPKTGGMKPSDYSVKDYLHYAQQSTSLRGMQRQMGLTYSGMRNDLIRRGIFAHVSNLLEEDPHRPGPKNRPPMVEIEGAGPDEPPNIEAILRSAEALFDAKDERAKKKANQHVRFPHGPVALCFLGDQHIGSAGTDIKRVFAEQKLILKTPGAYCWQMGDLVDNFIVGKLMAENMKPGLAVWHQWVLAEHYLHAFGQRLVAYTGGNHGAWTLKMTGIDYRRDVTPSGVLYDGDRLDAKLHVGDATFRVSSRHKWAGSSIYNPTHGQERGAFRDDPNHDIYVGAHLHKGAVSREFIHNHSRKISVLTGTYKKHDDYALEKGFASHDSSTAVCVILHDDGSFFGMSNLLAMHHYMSQTYKAA